MADPQPPDITAATGLEQIIGILHTIVEAGQEDLAREMIAMTPLDKLEELLKVADDKDYVFLSWLMPKIPGPIYDPEFTKPEQPTIGDVLEMASLDKGWWQPVIDRVAMDQHLYHMEWVGKSRSFDPSKDSEFYSSTLSDEIRAIAALASGTNSTYTAKLVTVDNREEAQRIEDTAAYWESCCADRYYQVTGGHLTYDEMIYLLITGYIVTRIGIKLQAGTYPFHDALIDPQIVYPRWDGNGLMRVTTQYQDTVANVISDFEHNGNTVKNKLLGSENRMAKGRRRYRLNDVVEVTTYHDRWWFAVVADGIPVIRPTAHKYGKVPYVITGSQLGEPMGMTGAHVVNEGNDRLFREVPTEEASRRLRYKNVGWAHFRKINHGQREVILGKLYTMIQNADRPAWALYQDDLADGDPIIEIAPDAVNKLSQHERLEPLFATMDHRVWGPLFSALQSAEMTNSLPPEMFGVPRSANQSGNGLEGAYESGKDKLATFIRAIENHKGAKASFRLMLYRDWGEHLQNEDGDYAVHYVPHTRERQRAYNLPSKFVLTPQTIERVGHVVHASMVHLRMQNLGPLGAAASMWIDKGMMSKREAMEMRGVNDPDAVIAEVNYERAQEDEMLAKAKMLRDMKTRDPDLYELYRELLEFEHAKTNAPPPGSGFGNQPGMAGPDYSAMGMGPQGPTGRPLGAMGPGAGAMQGPGMDLSLLPPSPGGLIGAP